MKDTTECKKGQKKTVQYVICNAHCNSDHIYKPVSHELDIATQCENAKCFQSRNATVFKFYLHNLPKIQRDSGMVQEEIISQSLFPQLLIMEMASKQVRSPSKERFQANNTPLSVIYSVLKILTGMNFLLCKTHTKWWYYLEDMWLPISENSNLHYQVMKLCCYKKYHGKLLQHAHFLAFFLLGMWKTILRPK